MSVFLNKKEQVYDLKLTSYGRYLLSIGTFKPAYYAFFDDNVIYDARYFHTAAVLPGAAGGGNYLLPPKREAQNNINQRIKRETPYLGSQVLFRDVEDTLSALEVTSLGYDSDINPTLTTPAADIYTFESALGDAMLDAENSQAVPSWKMLMLQSTISSSIYKQSTQPASADGDGSPYPIKAENGILLNSQIPQIQVIANYSLKVVDSEIEINPTSVRNLIDTSNVFSDNKVIALISEDPIIYFEETNTQVLTENFDVEVFEVESGSAGEIYKPTLHRKYFETVIPQIENGFMLTETPSETGLESLTTDSVEYYFDILQDSSVDQAVACNAAEAFNKSSYYVSFDFECAEEDSSISFYDIYGSVTEPEICQD